MIYGNWVDIAVLVFCFFYIWEGFARGFLSYFFESISFGLGLVVGLIFYVVPAQFLETHFVFPVGLANSVSILAIIITVQQIVSFFLGMLSDLIPTKIQHHPLNKVLTLPALGVNLVFVLASLTLAATGLPYHIDVKRAVVSSYMVQTLSVFTNDVEAALLHDLGFPRVSTFNMHLLEPNSENQINLNITDSLGFIDAPVSQNVFEKINDDRQKNNLAPLTRKSQLDMLARTQAIELFAHGYLSTMDFSGTSYQKRLALAGFNPDHGSEIVGLVATTQLIVARLSDASVYSGVLLYPQYRSVGIAVVDSGIYGYMVVVDFSE